jgi:hypothetical protein
MRNRWPMADFLVVLGVVIFMALGLLMVRGLEHV